MTFPDESSPGETTFLVSKKSRVERYHEKIPYLRRLPAPVCLIILAVALVNAGVWVAVAIVLHFHSALLPSAILAYTLGLRHALDADHIAAIDLMTRRLIAAGQKPVAVGTFFSLGHSTIVIITSIAVAATSASLSEKFDTFERIGGIVGSSVSAAFLVVLAVLNTILLVRLVRKLRRVLETGTTESDEEVLASAGWLVRWLHRAFTLVDAPWKMYPLGVLFGLGFDTSSEVALLGLASLHAAGGESIWLILVFPVLFTAGMCLLDTADGALMSALYTSSAEGSDGVKVLYSSVVLTGITVVVAVVVGTLQVLTLVDNVAEPEGRFWDGVERIGEVYEVVGAGIVGLFVVGAVVGVVAYRPWRRWVGRRMEGRVRLVEEGV